ncbi:MAG TPA: phosphatidylglycerol lysyltransferase domain-containing protein [Candidatus Saccharimonadales bacterium]|nr:phosphatidylglycerol lysyltransferase domain-containing protein [Candidatus Saccharimonadales bacterium]
MFKTFPEFSKLTLADREEYESFIKDYPPVADISFGSLMTWWNELHPVKVAQLNGNLVIQYWSHEDERNSGLSLVGINKVDESICEIFDYLRSHDFPVRLANVPNFVIDHVAYPGMFNFREQRDHQEYVLDLNKFYPIDKLIWFRRKKVERQLKQFADVRTRQLDFSNEDNLKLVLDMVDESWNMNMTNFGKLEQRALRASVLYSSSLGFKNVCLFVNGSLQGVCIYQSPPDKDFVILHHFKAGSTNLADYELMAHKFAEWFISQGARLINVNTDAGLVRLRMFMLALGPVDFFRKHVVEPA